MATLRSLASRLVRILGPDPRAVAQSTVALVISIIATLIAGITLAGNEERLAALPGLLLLVPAAIAQRGNVFGALGSRLGTAIHTGEFRISRHVDTVFGQNVLASFALSIVAATWLAIVAWALAQVFAIADAMSLLNFIAVSLIGGTIASVVVLVITVALAAGSSRFGWDLDNVVAPLVTATGDLATLPALLIGSLIVTPSLTGEVIALIGATIAVIVSGFCLRSGLSLMRRIFLESVPVLALASTLSLIAGITVEKRLSSFLDQPALLILVPAYFGMAGALGGILSSRLGTKVHLGLIEPTRVPQRRARADIRSIAVIAVPIFALVGLAAHVSALIVGVEGPGLGLMVATASLAGVGATLIVLMVAYYGTLGSVRFGLDPDTATIPLTNSVLDLVGAFTLVGTILLLGVA